ncbi:hypothetical protein [Bacillus sp. 7894-2]|uniref:hypothetical protein n=1 Tax=Bacillus sp. 7894-2 TaxID=2021695 RepID=UPI000BA768FB|nr:hypothetical protein [Bacillus sp. 7894-2]
MLLGCLRNNGDEVAEVRYILLIAVIGLLVFILFRMFKFRRGISNSNFTPIDDMDNGLAKGSGKKPHKIELRSEISYEVTPDNKSRQNK